MDIDEIKSILNNRIAFNERERSAALNRGDLDAVARIDADTAKT